MEGKCEAREVLVRERAESGEKMILKLFGKEILLLDYDLLSLEFPALFRQIFALEDTSLLSAVSKSLAGIKVGHLLVII